MTDSIDSDVAGNDCKFHHDVFKDIEDPVAFQRQLRDEWTREWDK